MVNIAAYVSAVTQHLQADDVLSALVDGQVVPGFRRANADQYLAGPQEACIGVRSLSKNSQPLGGAALHGGAKHDQLMEIRIITLLSATRQDDSYAYAIGAEVERLLRCGFSETLNSIVYNLDSIPNINFTSLDDDLFNDRIEIQATVRLKYIGV
jgi:hypothetical protein